MRKKILNLRDLIFVFKPATNFLCSKYLQEICEEPTLNVHLTCAKKSQYFFDIMCHTRT